MSLTERHTILSENIDRSLVVDTLRDSFGSPEMPNEFDQLDNDLQMKMISQAETQLRIFYQIHCAQTRDKYIYIDEVNGVSTQLAFPINAATEVWTFSGEPKKRKKIGQADQVFGKFHVKAYLSMYEHHPLFKYLDFAYKAYCRRLTDNATEYIYCFAENEELASDPDLRLDLIRFTNIVLIPEFDKFYHPGKYSELITYKIDGSNYKSILNDTIANPIVTYLLAFSYLDFMENPEGEC